VEWERIDSIKTEGYCRRLIFIPSLKILFTYKYSFKYFIIFRAMETANYSNFRSNLKYWFDKVVNDVSDVIIKRKGGKDLVLISLDQYNSLKETTYLLTGKNRDVLLNSIKELESGSVVYKDLLDK